MIVSEDHIKILKALIYILPQDYYSATVEESLEIAVKLLENSNGLIAEELEKIKADLEDYSRYTAGNDLVVDWENIEEVFIENISELKGENK